jgi:5-(carboxyamino)imidazole ribonucleotide mutase
MTAVTPRVAVLMGSDSDHDTMRPAAEVLREFGIEHEVRVVSAHRTPAAMLTFGQQAAGRGLEVLIAGAGGAAHLPGMLPVPLSRLDGIDSLLSIAQMPAGIPVATVAIGNARNAGLLAVRILAVGDEALTAALELHQRSLAARSARADRRVRDVHTTSAVTDHKES